MSQRALTLRWDFKGLWVVSSRRLDALLRGMVALCISGIERGKGSDLEGLAWRVESTLGAKAVEVLFVR